MGQRRLRAAIAAIAALGEPQRLRLFEFVASSTEPVTRDQAAEALGIKRNLAAFHLDKLVEQGFLETEFRQLNERKGPGSGRPSKLYFRSSREFEISTPERHYDTAATLLAAGIERSKSENVDVEEGIKRAAEDYGRALAAQLQTNKKVTVAKVCQLLEERGYEPADENGEIVLRNCPFHRLSKEHTDLVCNMNLEIFKALDSAAEDVELNPRLHPHDAHCCVRLQAAKRR